MKKFGDLKKGDLLYVVNLKSLEVQTHKIIEIKPLYNLIRFTLENNHSTRFLYKNYSRDRLIFTSEEQAYNYLEKRVKVSYSELEEKIDQMVQEYDRLNDFLKEHSEVIVAERGPNFGGLKPGTTIYQIDKTKFKVERTKIKNIEPAYSIYFSTKSYNTGKENFTAYIESDRSFSGKFYTTYNRAFQGLIGFAKKRVKYVEDKIDKTIKYFNQVENYLNEKSI